MHESKTVEALKNVKKSQALYAVHFMETVELIKNVAIQKFVRDVLINHAPDYFWTIPASTSGKYHNEDECVEGGLLTHVKRVINMSITIMKGIGWYDHKGLNVREDKIDDYNIVLAAIILHDILKSGFEGRERKKNGELSTDSLHPYYVREQLKMKKIEGKDEYFYKLPFFDSIMRAIEGHYGYWSTIPNTANLNDAQSPVFVVYMSDFIASRKLDLLFKV